MINDSLTNRMFENRNGSAAAENRNDSAWGETGVFGGLQEDDEEKDKDSESVVIEDLSPVV